MNYIEIIDILGVIAFAISGVLTAIKKRLDIFGILIIAFVTSVGGGTLRDLLIGSSVAWLRNLTYVYTIIITTIIAIIFRKKLNYLRKSLFLFDTLGIALYTIIGIEKALAAGFSPIICIAIGTMTACFGGVIRDILCHELPVIFHKEIYATACIIGGIIYFILNHFHTTQAWVFLISGFCIVFIRTLAVYFDLRLPSIYGKNE